MPIHLEDLDVVSQAAEVRSALIVPCNMCPAVTAAIDRKLPFMRLFRSFLRSEPFEQHIEELQSQLGDRGIATEVFKSPLYYQWFLCMWTEGRRQKLRKRAEKFDAVVVLGCDTANETVREAVKPTGVKVIEGMRVTGFMNAKMTFDLTGNISFKDCRIIPISQRG